MKSHLSYNELKGLGAHKCGNGIYVVVTGETGHVYTNSPTQGAKLDSRKGVMLALIKSGVMDTQSRAAITAAPTL